MSGSLIDTNVIIRFWGGDETASKLIQQADDLFIPVTVVGELLYGAQKSKRKQENLAMIHDFLVDYEVLNIDVEVAETYSEIKAQLVMQGINIPENDMWIAAMAKANQYALITFDSHFSQIEGIKVISPC